MTGEERKRAILNLRKYLLAFASLLGAKSRTKDCYRRMNQVMGAAYFTAGLFGMKGEEFKGFLHEILDAFVQSVDEKERVSIFGTLRSIVLEDILEEEIDLNDDGRSEL